MMTAMCCGSRSASSSPRRRCSSRLDDLSESGTFTPLVLRIPRSGLRPGYQHSDVEKLTYGITRRNKRVFVNHSRDLGRDHEIHPMACNLLLLVCFTAR